MFLISDDVLTATIALSANEPIANGSTIIDAAIGTDLGLARMDGSQLSQTFTIENTGVLPLNVANIMVDGAHASDFSVVGPAADVVAVGESTTFDVFFDPTDDGLRQATIDITSDDADQNSYQFDVAATATDVWVEDVILNAGGSDRSQITSVDVIFNRSLFSRGIEDAFTLRHVDVDAEVTGLQVRSSFVDGTEKVTLTFNDGDYVESRIGQDELANSLVDGNYELTIRGRDILYMDDMGGSSNMDYDHVFGGQKLFEPDNDDFFRLYGDSNGDGIINGIDINAIRKSLSRDYVREMDAKFDANGDGILNGIDINAIRAALTKGPRL